MKTALRVFIGSIMLIAAVAVSSADNAAYDAAAADVTLLLQQGQDESACAQMAKGIADEVTDSVSEQQKILNTMENGSSCGQQADEATGLSAAQAKKDSTAKDAADAAAAVTDAQNSPVDFGILNLKALKSQSCAPFFEDPAYIAAKQQVADAKTASVKAAGAAEAAADALKTVQAAADEEKKICLCKVRDVYDEAWLFANEKNEANAVAWQKAALMECVLAGTATADCKIPDVPKPTPLTLDEGVPATTCQVHCDVSNWGQWGACSKPCAGGIQGRSRTISTKAAYGGNTCPALTSEQSCNLHPCPIDCKVSSYGAWTRCSKACGSGTKTHSRTITQDPLYGGKACPALSAQASCNTHNCPVNCVMKSWGSWGSCNKACGKGLQSRSRSIAVNAAHGGTPCGDKTASQSCNTHNCPINCAVSGWKAWGSCSKDCGSGVKSRARTITTNPAFKGNGCPALSQTQACNTHGCAVHCEMSAWSAWGTCSKQCGTGNKVKTRSITKAPANGGNKCGDLTVSETCHSKPCPIDCKLGQWNGWQRCDSKCGPGTQTRSRDIKVANNYGGKGCDTRTESKSCNQKPCPVDCAVSSWGAYSSCSRNCGPGTKTRKRSVSQAALFGGKKCSSLTETKSCNNGGCPVHCATSGWGSWGSCSKTCGGGTQTRTKRVTTKSANGGKDCPALTDRKSCNTQSCQKEYSISLSVKAQSKDSGDCSESGQSEMAWTGTFTYNGKTHGHHCTSFVCNNGGWCSTDHFKNQKFTAFSADPNAVISVDYIIRAFESDSSGNHNWRNCKSAKGDDCLQDDSGYFKIDLGKKSGSKTLDAARRRVQHRASVSWTVTPK